MTHIEALSLRNMARSALSTGNKYHTERSLRSIDDMYDALIQAWDEIERLQNVGCEHYREALEFYANPEHYEAWESYTGRTNDVSYDEGKIAREALKGESK